MVQQARTHVQPPARQHPAPRQHPAQHAPRQRPKYKVRGAFIYCRISDPQNRITTDRQKARATAYVRDVLNVSVLEVFVDARSGYLQRRQYDDMMFKAKLGLCSHVVLYDFDRFGRDRIKMLQDYEELMILQIEVHDCTEGHITHARAGEKALQAEAELRANSRRVTDAMLDRARDEENYAMPRRVPVGYKPTPGQPGQPQIDRPLADLVEQLFIRYDSGATEGALKQWWNKQTGDHKRTTGITSILRNEYYAGYDVFNKTRNSKLRTEGRFVHDESDWIRREHNQPIVDRDLFHRVQAKLDQNERRGHKYGGEARHSLTGIVDCAGCGNRLVVHKSTTNNKAKISCQFCRGCRAYWRVDDTLRDALDRIPLGTEQIAACQPIDDAPDPSEVEHQMSLLRDARGRLWLRHEMGEVGKDDFDSAIRHTDARLRELEEELAATTTNVTREYLTSEVAKWLSGLSNWTDILDVDTTTAAQKNNVYRQCCERVVVNMSSDTMIITWSVGIAALVGEGVTHLQLRDRPRHP